jgi:isochorismate synthase EntC
MVKNKLLSTLLLLNSKKYSLFLKSEISIKGSNKKLHSILSELLFLISANTIISFADKNKSLYIGINGNANEKDNDTTKPSPSLEIITSKIRGKDCLNFEISQAKDNDLNLTFEGFNFKNEENLNFKIYPDVLIKLKNKKLSIISIKENLFSFIDFNKLSQIISDIKNSMSKVLFNESLNHLNDSLNKADIHSSISFTEFEKNISEFKNSKLDKVILARSINIPLNNAIDVKDITNSCLNKFLKSNLFNNYFFSITTSDYNLLSAFKNLPKETDNIYSFVSLTPETLFSTNSNKIFSEALAGSLSPEDGDLILSDQKNLLENNIVVQSIIEDLQPFTKTLTVMPPQTVKLPYIVHLITKIKGRLNSSIQINEIISKLHPTPATLGYPKQNAFEFLNKNLNINIALATSEYPLNYYAGTAGIVTHTKSKQIKNSKFIVLLRSASISKHQINAYVGAGIINKSNPKVEWIETSEKSTPILKYLFTDFNVNFIKQASTRIGKD